MLPNLPTPIAGTRPDVHNCAVDESVAAHRLCGVTHLATGHVCLLPERHAGGCDFVDPAPWD